MAIDDEQMDRIVNAIRSIAHGGSLHPTGLELLAMAFSRDGEPSISSALDILGTQIEDIATALTSIAHSMENKNGN